jgi:hypothetical protein
MAGSRISNNLLQLFKIEKGALIFEHVFEPTFWCSFAILEAGNPEKGGWSREYKPAEKGKWWETRK